MGLRDWVNEVLGLSQKKRLIDIQQYGDYQGWGEVGESKGGINGKRRRLGLDDEHTI